ncbi:hypothetical protein KGF56_003435 [Candida oxycetoniae]|uniref:Uncharacterized protein n=1 Tax=Candida oxycetoniae TaxID=497107 RepID=A0AAI9SW40_9ASCO|nr:uncharacterized protein KGF56_003435 [Candida oxycetoniae]KAI3403800.2 hypothetical protein KGF56_003435 [Candida oxycetoniae]
MPAHFRPSNGDTKLLSPLDLARPEHGTWIGVTTSGKVAVLVNYRDVDTEYNMKETSRGVLPLNFLCSNDSDEEWKKRLMSKMQSGTSDVDFKKIGGFTLLYGSLKIDPKTNRIDHLNILSNRGHYGKVFESHSSSEEDEHCSHYDDDDEIASKSTFGLSNSLYNEPWKKVYLGEDLVKRMISRSIEQGNWTENRLVEECFSILSQNTYKQSIADQDDYDLKLLELRNSIFVPPIDLGGENSTCVSIGKYYGTRTQTVILLDKCGYLHYYEKNLHSSDIEQLDKPQIVSHYKFSIFDDSQDGKSNMNMKKSM